MDAASVTDSELDAVIARLRAEVEATEAQVGGGPAWAPARTEAGRLAAVSGDRPFHRRSGALGRARSALTAPVKFVIRKVVRWYVEPIAAEQRAFNGAVLRLVDDVAEWTASGLGDVRRDAERAAGDLSRRVDETAARTMELDVRLEARLAALTRRAGELEDRLLRVERRPATPAPAGAEAARPAAAVPAPSFDYFAFEARMREDRDEIRRRQAPYVEDFRDAAPVVDVGCGRGEFLGLLREAGIDARGVDSDADMVAFCRGEGLAVQHGDALAYLEATEPALLGGVFAAHFVEHLPPPALVRFLALCAQALRPGGLLVLETPNPVSLVALKHYFADLTHAQPLVPETLAFLVAQAGLRVEDTRYLNEPAPAERLRPVRLPPAEGFAEAQAAEDANVQRLNEVVFGPQDYAVVARR